MFPSLWNTIWIKLICSRYFLVYMGFLTLLKGGNTRVCSQGWDDLSENFKTNYLELSIQR